MTDKIDERTLGTGHRYFYADDADRVHRLSQADMIALRPRREGGSVVAKLKGIKRLRYVLVFYRTHNRQPYDVKHVSPSIMPLDGRGGLDAKEWSAQMHASVSMVGLGLEEMMSKPLAGPTVVDAKKQFRQRAKDHARRQYDAKYKWEPTDAIYQQIRTMLYGPAGPPPKGGSRVRRAS